MEIDAVPVALRERLGTEATTGLLTLLDHAQSEGRAAVIAACTERFERRLVEEVAGMRVQIAQVDADIRVDMARMGADIRKDMAEMGAGIREDMARMGAGIREDMALMGAALRQEISAGRVELLKWCFLFWIGQVVAVGTLVGVMLRLVR